PRAGVPGLSAAGRPGQPAAVRRAAPGAVARGRRPAMGSSRLDRHPPDIGRPQRSVVTSTLRVAMIGYAFMGAAHSQGWRTAPHVFDLPITPEMALLVGRSPERVAE